MGAVISTLIGVLLTVLGFFALFFAMNKVLDLARTQWSLFTGMLGLLLGLLVGGFLNGNGVGGGFFTIIAGGVVGAGVGAGLGQLRDLPPTRRAELADKVRPWVFVGPALFAVGITLVIPTIRTAVLALKDRRSENWIGIDNFQWIFTNDDLFNVSGVGDIFTSRLFIVGVIGIVVGLSLAVYRGREIGVNADFENPSTLGWLGIGLTGVLFAMFTVLSGVIWNNLWWVFSVTVFATGLGLFVAAVTNRMERGERVAKAIIFLPMAISMVGASVIWRFVYNFQPPGETQIGALNAVMDFIGRDPVPWLIRLPWNTFFLIIVMIWIQAGFAMVILSSAIKAVPGDQVEAARVDGATDRDIFWRVTIPNIRSTIAVVVTTLIVVVMKVYDIVKVMTNGEFDTNVIANEMFDQAFRFTQAGRGAALATVLLIFVAPIMVINIRRVQKEAALR
ncbi:MAG: sugar ABC transporter permease [Acidimicrobiia bacterium]|nr:sugar ABC transporter permease [Acidimicrobiia bacterium]NNF89605.1 sugar ABC transporter permease [Acidimicrobiia bacterium]RZV47340.1 MAG: sugar ABC transporter permease [Acidimicrobiia bacterium]